MGRLDAVKLVAPSCSRLLFPLSCTRAAHHLRVDYARGRGDRDESLSQGGQERNHKQVVLIVARSHRRREQTATAAA